MPSKSPAQHRLMEAAAHTKGGVGGVPQKVGKEFVEADEGKFKRGGRAQQAAIAIAMKDNKMKPKKMADGGHPGLYANINAKRKRIEHEKAAGLPVERMRKVGSKGAPTADSFVQSAKTAKMKDGGKMKSCW
jgi:hypothetical protein